MTFVGRHVNGIADCLPDADDGLTSSAMSSHELLCPTNIWRMLGSNQVIARPPTIAIATVNIPGYVICNRSVPITFRSCDFPSRGANRSSSALSDDTPLNPAMPDNITLAEARLSARKNTHATTTARNVSAPPNSPAIRPPSPQPSRAFNSLQP